MELGTTCTLILLEIGYFYYQRESFTKAVEFLKEVVELEPDNFYTWKYMARVFAKFLIFHSFEKLPKKYIF